ncbi:MCE family protein [Actinocorallia longicatena]|uniref:MCE family protein n=1 Tax=Actinocorallia longicatena TaxID=111803 RepID=A0ABP6QA42_9ACTN
MTPTPRGLSAVAAAAAAVLTLSSCSVLPGMSGGSTYKVTAFFTKAVSFYPGSRVQVMGVNVGRVESVVTENGQVRVVASIESRVPLPDKVTAAIMPLSLIGERTLTFSPAWRPGEPRLAKNAVLPAERTRVPVEVNEALTSFGRLLDSFDPAKVNGLIGKAATSLNGNGTAFNQAFEQTARLVTQLSGQDEKLLAVAGNLNRLAGAVKGREKVLGSLIDDFSTATTMLAGERKNIQTLITAVADLARRGNVIIDTYDEKLPDDLVRMAQVALSLKVNAKSLGKLLNAIPGLSYQFVNAYDPKKHAINSRITLDHFVRSYLAAILKEPRINSKVPCPLPPPYSNCE